MKAAHLPPLEAGETDTASAVSVLWALYRGTSLPQRTLAALRPYICPVHPILNAVPQGSEVLDIGCGNGLALLLMARFRGIRRGTGIEISQRALVAARKVSAEAGLPLTFVECGGFEAWPDEQFETVTMIDVLHHVPKPIREQFITQALQRVAPGGRFVFKDMAARPWWRASWNMFHDIVLARQLVHVEPAANVIAWAAQAGFRPQSMRAYVACGLYGHELLVFERR
jgi:2-polyprenyl-3-methyl-5-hydroxy-6-metoxy-1,4-benzoquinol methylase